MKVHTVLSIALVFVMTLGYGFYFGDLTLSIIIGNSAAAIGYVITFLFVILILPSVLSVILLIANQKWPHKTFMVSTLIIAFAFYLFLIIGRLYIESYSALTY